MKPGSDGEGRLRLGGTRRTRAAVLGVAGTTVTAAVSGWPSRRARHGVGASAVGTDSAFQTMNTTTASRRRPARYA